MNYTFGIPINPNKPNFSPNIKRGQPLTTDNEFLKKPNSIEDSESVMPRPEVGNTKSFLRKNSLKCQVIRNTSEESKCTGDVVGCGHYLHIRNILPIPGEMPQLECDTLSCDKLLAEQVVRIMYTDPKERLLYYFINTDDRILGQDGVHVKESDYEYGISMSWCSEHRMIIQNPNLINENPNCGCKSGDALVNVSQIVRQYKDDEEKAKEWMEDVAISIQRCDKCAGLLSNCNINLDKRLQCHQ